MINQATPIVLMHAFPLNSTMWEPQRSVLEGRRVIAPDFPGFGGLPADATSLDDFADHVLAELRATGATKAVFVGLSMGGYVAFRILARSPDSIAALVLADTRGGADTEAAAQRRTDQAGRVRREGVAWLADELVESLLAESTRRERPDVVDAVRAMILAADPEGVARALIAMRDRPDSTPLLADVSVPVLALVGEHDEPTPPAESSRIAGSVQDGRFVVIPNAGHISNLEASSAFNEELNRFLTELES